LNYPECPDSCDAVKLTLRIDVAEVLVDRPDVLAVQDSELLLGEPHRAVRNPDVHLYRPIVSNEDKELASSRHESRFVFLCHSTASTVEEIVRPPWRRCMQRPP
jgi:hypothetical protein